jgi:chemotaxis protein histidine kinase CheA
MNLSSDNKLVDDFILVARDHLTNVSVRLAWLERAPLERGQNDAAATYAIWRSFYTIKCLAGFLNLSILAEIAYQIETALTLAQTGDLTISTQQAHAIVAASDHLERQIDELDSAGARSDLASTLA